MTGTPHTRSGDAIAIIRLEHLRRDDLRSGDGIANDGAELPSAWSPTRSADNVVPFARPRHGEPAKRSAILDLAVDERPAPAWALPESRVRMASLVTLSVAVHVGLYAIGWRDPEPLDSVAIETISIEIVLGGETVAGLPKSLRKSRPRPPPLWTRRA